MMIWEDLYIYFFSPKFQYMMFLNLFSSLWARNTCTHSWRILESSWHVAVAEFSLFFSRLCSLIRGYLHDTFLLKMSRNKPEWGSFVKTEACVARRHGALSIQRKFRFEISEISGAQWTCTFRLDRPDPSHRAFGYCSCKQDTKERHWTTILSNGKGHFGPTDRNDQTGQSGPSSKLVPNIPVGPNGNGPFHLVYQPKFPELWVEWKAPMNWGPVHKYPFLFENRFFFSDLVYRPHVSGENTENGSFKNAPQSEDFRKRRLFVYVWKDEDGGFRTLWRRAKTIPKDA